MTGVAVSSDAGADRTYAQGETIRVTLTFHEPVNVTGAPRVKLDFGSGAGDERWADYAGGSGTKVLEFAYTVAEGDASDAGVAVLANTLELNGGTIQSASAAGESATLAHAGLNHDPKHRVDSKPHVTGVAISSDAGDDATYALGETVRVRLTFSEAVAVTGTPRLKLGLGSGVAEERWAVYASGSGTAMLEFAYTVAEGDESSAGVAVLENTLALNGGTIKSTTAAGENATLAHLGLGRDPAHRMDIRPPTLSVAFVNGGGPETHIQRTPRCGRIAGERRVHGEEDPARGQRAGCEPERVAGHRRRHGHPDAGRRDTGDRHGREGELSGALSSGPAPEPASRLDGRSRQR